jgi:transglutaminase-like putative cysteine protease
VDSQLNTAAAVEYAPDDPGDHWQTPEETVRRGRGDCEDLAFYLHHLLRRQGMDSMVVFGIQDVTAAETGHAWVECRMYGETYVLDPTCRLLASRRALPYYRYYALLRQPELTEKLRDYLRRTGQSNVNPTFEAVLEARSRRSGQSAGKD